MKVVIDERVVDNTAKKAMASVETLIKSAESDSPILRNCEFALIKIDRRITEHYEKKFDEYSQADILGLRPGWR